MVLINNGKLDSDTNKSSEKDNIDDPVSKEMQHPSNIRQQRLQKQQLDQEIERLKTMKSTMVKVKHKYRYKYGKHYCYKKKSNYIYR